MSAVLQSELLDALENNLKLSAEFRQFTRENSRVFAEDSIDSDSAPILDFLKAREQFIESLTQLSGKIKEMEAQVQGPPPSLGSQVSELHFAIDENIRAILSIDQRNIEILKGNMQLYHTKIKQTRGKKKQISSYLRSELAGIDVHQYDKIR